MAREIKSAKEIALQNESGTPNPYKERLVKLIPSEIVAAYLTLSGLIIGSSTNNPGEKNELALWIIIGILLVITPFYLKKISGVNKTEQILFSTIGFFIWALATCSPYDEKILELPFDIVISIVLILYTLLIPLFYKG
jgi:hypothetical protein